MYENVNIPIEYHWFPLWRLTCSDAWFMQKPVCLMETQWFSRWCLDAIPNCDFESVRACGTSCIQVLARLVHISNFQACKLVEDPLSTHPSVDLACSNLQLKVHALWEKKLGRERVHWLCCLCSPWNRTCLCKTNQWCATAHEKKCATRAQCVRVDVFCYVLFYVRVIYHCDEGL